jgi:predicted anti-sigma-YlaC factor YlaD
MSCEEARRELALGHDERAERHLRECESCRLESARVGELVRALAESAVVAPPATVDDRVRRALAQPSPHARPLPSPITVSGLAVAAYSAIVFGIGIWLASSGLAESAPALTAAIAATYLAVCAAASLPLLIRRGRLRPIELQEVRS